MSNSGTPSPSRAAGSSGSVLALVPAGFLVLMVLAALAADSAVVYLGQRQLHDALVAAANDGVAAGLDSTAFYRSGLVTLDPADVERAVCADLAGLEGSHLHHLSVAVAVAGTAVRVDGQATVDAVFGRALPGFATRSVSSTADASFASGPRTGPPPVFGPPAGLRCGPTP